MNKRAVATSITKEVKKKVWERDKHRCIFCGTPYALPEGHALISRAYGGIGEERNVITLCRFCHMKFDNGTKEQREPMKAYVKKYLFNIYGEFDIEELRYRKKWKH